MTKFVDRTGRRYGKLKVISMHGRDKWRNITWLSLGEKTKI